MALAFLNGRYLPAEQASVSVFDRGYTLGDGVYEVIPVYHGQIFRLQPHLERLQRSLDGLRITNPYHQSQWQDILQTLVANNGGGEQSLYVQVTRGVALRDHAFPADCVPSTLVISSEVSSPSPQHYPAGVSAITLADSRWQHCHIKTISLAANVLLRQQAAEQGCAEAILIRDGLLTEGAASNILIVERGVIVTPPPSQYLLSGITRDLISVLAKQHKIGFIEENVPVARLRQADEIWMSSSLREITAITQLDGQRVGNGEPGPLWRQMLDLYRDYKNSLAAL